MKTKSLSFDFIENSGPDNLRDTLKSLLSQTSTKEVCILVAFVTQSGLDELAQHLRQVAIKGKVRFITGLYQRVTEPKALETLLKIQDETRGRFSAKLSRDPQLHRKFYIVESSAKTIAIVGSSNLTKEGLQSGGEINLIISSPRGENSTQKLKKIFEKEWKHRSISLSAVQVSRYDAARNKPPAIKSFNQNEIKKILGVETTHQQASLSTSSPRNVDYWRDCVDGYLGKRTNKILSETTNWDKKNYSWYAPGAKHSYHLNDRIFLFDMKDNRLRLVEIADIARTKIPTPDGRNFIAYKYVRGYGKKLTDNLWQSLKEEGITKGNVNKRVDVKIEVAKRLMRLINTKRA
ncbi:MAG: hypothetical protein IT310_02525 [Anaerolineales bacterium]|nr:hypothetical protein [Anaerolineales bacterium]